MTTWFKNGKKEAKLAVDSDHKESTHESSQLDRGLGKNATTMVVSGVPQSVKLIVPRVHRDSHWIRIDEQAVTLKLTKIVWLTVPEEGNFQLRRVHLLDVSGPVSQVLTFDLKSE